MRSGIIGLVMGVLFSADCVIAQSNGPECGPFPSGQDAYSCSCPPMSEAYGAVWGTEVFTLDSDICMAALHAGAIGIGGGNVTAYAMPGEDGYLGSMSNGVPSNDWGAYDASFMFEVLVPDPIYTEDVIKGAVRACAGLPDDLDLLTCSCTPGATGKGTFWGNDPYTSDSDICIAARHSGISTETGGTVMVIRVFGLDSYSSSENNGVESLASGPFGSSMVFDRN